LRNLLLFEPADMLIDFLFIRTSTYDNSVVPSKYSQFVESSYKIPTRSDVAGYEDRKSEDRKWVHESPAIAGASGASPAFSYSLELVVTKSQIARVRVG